MIDEMNVYASSTDSPKIYLDNNPTDFTIELPEQINFNSKWLIALTEIHILDIINHPIYICSDICTPSMEPLHKVIYPDCIHLSNLTYVRFLETLNLIKEGESGSDGILTKKVCVSLHLMKKYE